MGDASRPAAAPDLPLDHELAAESDTRKEAYIAAMDSMIKACPACGIVRKCTLESSMPAVQREHAAVQRAVADHMNTTVFTRLLLTGCGALEQATQLPPVKARVDLQGFTHAVAHDPAVAENLKLIIAQYPELTKLLTPEAKRGIALPPHRRCHRRRHQRREKKQRPWFSLRRWGERIQAVIYNALTW